MNSVVLPGIKCLGRNSERPFACEIDSSGTQNSHYIFSPPFEILEYQLHLCCTRSTPSYKLLSEYNLILTQRLTSYPLVLVELSCGSFSFARVTSELPISRTVVALHRKGDARVTNELLLVDMWLLCVAGTYLCS
jgi:hypothetical protein